MLFTGTAAAACGGASGRDAAPSVASRPFVASGVEHVDRKAREPMLVEHPNGALFVSGYGEAAPTLWKSTDRGTTWTRVDVGSTEQGAVGNSDVDLAVAPDGTLYFVAMLFDAKAGEGRRISIGVSHDVGEQWAWTRLSEARYDDRPWVEVSADGTAHVIWNDGSGVKYAVSTDRGASWKRQPKIAPHGGSSHLAVGPGQLIAVRVPPLSASGAKVDREVDLIMVSADGGRTWQQHSAPSAGEWKSPNAVGPNDTIRWVEPLAWDTRGTLYSAWAEQDGVRIARSTDRGQTWRTTRVVQTGGFFPYLIARGAGELAVTWFSGTMSSAADRFVSMEGHIARIDVARAEADPRVVGAATLRLAAWNPGKNPSDPPELDSAGEYIATAFLADGSLVAVTPIQDSTHNRFGFTFWRIGEAPPR